MPNILWKQGESVLVAFGRAISCSCDVRNEINRRRLSTQVVYSIPDNLPYQPRVFPKGVWAVGKPIAKTDPYMAPWFIPTDAWQMVAVWDVQNGRYIKATEKKIKDAGYGLHYSTSPTTLGCLKFIKVEDIEWIAEQINDMLAHGKVPTMEVI